jgi:hypothetical protein
LEVVDRSEQQARVRGDDAVGVGPVDPVGVDQADLRRSLQPALQPEDIDERVIVAGRRRRRIVDRRKEGDVRARALARQLDGGER